MPKVVVYVPAAAWRKLEEKGLDPAQAVRDFAREGIEAVDSMRIVNNAGEVVARLPERGSAEAHRDPGPAESLATLRPRSESRDDHFKPDFKGGGKT